MSNIAIKVEDLGKRYLIRHETQESYQTFQDLLINGTKKIITTLNPFALATTEDNELVEEFWALKDVSFEIKKGDKVGIIGRNGAGKSTLLKILSRITEPTTGKIHINGRIASLLEVGTGFHPELTGRENIFLNGAILGMSRAEIKAKFDEIVAFAEVEKFLDVPVKRYSSGMYVRLAFSVAAHLEPEILVVDEVLSVGDVEFQKKCLGKMNDVSEDGRTIFFVSHDMGAVANLCTHGIFLDGGKINYMGSIEDTIKAYQQNMKATEIITQLKKIPENKYIKILDISLSQQNIKTTHFKTSIDTQLKVKYELKQDVKKFHVYFRIIAPSGDILFESWHDGQYEDHFIQKKGIYVSEAKLPANLFNEGHYRLEVDAALHNIQRFTIDSIVIPITYYKTGLINKRYPGAKLVGSLLLDIEWNTEKIS